MTMTKPLNNRRQPAKIEWIFGKILIVSLASIAIVVGYIAVLNAWYHIYSTASTLDIWLIIAVTTFVIATGVVMLGRYFERRLEIEAKRRTQKIEVYDDFLKELAQIFHREHNNDDLIAFLTVWQSKLILWSEGETLIALVHWHDSLMNQRNREHALMLLDDFIRALREEIGHSSTEIERGAFIHLMINHGAFLAAHSRTPQENHRPHSNTETSAP